MVRYARETELVGEFFQLLPAPGAGIIPAAREVMQTWLRRAVFDSGEKELPEPADHARFSGAIHGRPMTLNTSFSSGVSSLLIPCQIEPSLHFRLEGIKPRD